MNKLILWLLLATFIPVAAAETDFIPRPPNLYAKAWALMDYETGAFLTEHRADLPLPPASLTKIMTHYIVASELDQNNLKLDDVVRVSTNAWRKGNPSTGGSTMFLRENQKVKISDLIKGLVVQSGNDAAIVLSEHIAGSEQIFVDMMNQQAAILGMRNTKFQNSSGWPVADHYSSARDLAILTASLIRNFPDSYKIHSTKNYTFNGISQPNRNTLLWQDSTIDGVKTGSTDEAGYSLIASTKKGDMRYISVVLGTNSLNRRLEESKKLLAWGFRYFKTKTIYKKTDIIKDAKIWYGEKDFVQIGITQDIKLSLPRHSKAKLNINKVINSYIEAPIRRGEVVGSMQVFLGDNKIHEEKLVSLEAIKQGNFFKRTLDSISYFLEKLF